MASDGRAPITSRLDENVRCSFPRPRAVHAMRKVAETHFCGAAPSHAPRTTDDVACAAYLLGNDANNPHSET